MPDLDDLIRYTVKPSKHFPVEEKRLFRAKGVPLCYPPQVGGVSHGWAEPPQVSVGESLTGGSASATVRVVA